MTEPIIRDFKVEIDYIRKETVVVSAQDEKTAVAIAEHVFRKSHVKEFLFHAAKIAP